MVNGQGRALNLSGSALPPVFHLGKEAEPLTRDLV